jgi:hypothetical protein
MPAQKLRISSAGAFCKSAARFLSAQFASPPPPIAAKAIGPIALKPPSWSFSLAGISKAGNS